VPPGVGTKDYNKWELNVLLVDEKVVFSADPTEE
jgi:hypothetical protein